MPHLLPEGSDNGINILVRGCPIMLSSGSGDGGFLAEDPLHTSVLAGWFHPTVSSKTNSGGREEAQIYPGANREIYDAGSRQQKGPGH